MYKTRNQLQRIQASLDYGPPCFMSLLNHHPDNLIIQVAHGDICAIPDDHIVFPPHDEDPGAVDEGCDVYI